MKQTNATRRLGQQLQEKLGYIMLFEVSDPRLDLVTLTGVEVAVDRSYARIYVSCDPESYDEVLEALSSAKGRIRSLLARALDWRVTPELDFRIDRSTDEAERITRALEDRPATIDVEKDEEGYPIQADAAEGEDGDGAGAGVADVCADDADAGSAVASAADGEGDAVE